MDTTEIPNLEYIAISLRFAGEIAFLPCGTTVIITLGNQKGLITAISIRYEAISYEVTYLLAGEYKTIWVDKTQFTVSLSNNSIGFARK